MSNTWFKILSHKTRTKSDNIIKGILTNPSLLKDNSEAAQSCFNCKKREDIFTTHRRNAPFSKPHSVNYCASSSQQQTDLYKENNWEVHDTQLNVFYCLFCLIKLACYVNLAVPSVTLIWMEIINGRFTECPVDVLYMYK